MSPIRPANEAMYTNATAEVSPDSMAYDILPRTTIPPLSYQTFQLAHSLWMEKRNVEMSWRKPSLCGYEVDLWRLHVEVMLVGGPSYLSESYGRPWLDCFAILGAKLGFMRVLGDDFDSAPVVNCGRQPSREKFVTEMANTLAKIYQHLIYPFDLAYIQAFDSAAIATANTAAVSQPYPLWGSPYAIKGSDERAEFMFDDVMRMARMASERLLIECKRTLRDIKRDQEETRSRLTKSLLNADICTTGEAWTTLAARDQSQLSFAQGWNRILDVAVAV